MFNPAQISAQLAKLPDHALKQYASMHKNDPYTVALAVSEFNRRQQLRTAATPMPQGEQPKVVDQQLAQMDTEPMPEETGIAQLPAGNMEFAEGGVVGFSQGDVIEGAQIPRLRRAPSEAERAANIYYGLPPDADMHAVAPGMGIMDKLGALVPDFLKNPSAYYPSSFHGVRLRGDEDISQSAVRKSDMAIARRTPEAFTPAPRVEPEPSAPALPETKGSGVAAVARSKGIASPFSGDVGKQTESLIQRFYKDADRPKALSDEDAMAQVEKRIAASGYKPLEEEGLAKLAQERATAKEDRDWQTNMRLVEIGLGIAGGTSQYALENIAKGAVPGLQAMASDLKEFRKNESALNKAEMELKKAQNDFALRKSDAAAARVDKAQEKVDRWGESMRKSSIDVAQTYLKEQGDTARMRMQVEAIKARQGSGADALLQKEFGDLQAKVLDTLEKDVRYKMAAPSVQKRMFQDAFATQLQANPFLQKYAAQLGVGAGDSLLGVPKSAVEAELARRGLR